MSDSGQNGAVVAAAETGLRRRLRLLVGIPALAAAGASAAGWALHAGAGMHPGWVTAATAAVAAMAVAGVDRHLGQVSRQQIAEERQRHALLRKKWAEIEQADAAVQQAEAGYRRRVAEVQQREDRIDGWLNRIGTLLAEGRIHVAEARKKALVGERPDVPEQRAWTRTGEPFADIAQLGEWLRYEAVLAVADVSERSPSPASTAVDYGEVFAALAKRLHSLVSRALATLEALERDTEDPDVLHKLFEVDHLVTQQRRTVESLAILGGKTPRQVKPPVDLQKVIRQATSEVEHYPRVSSPLLSGEAAELAVPGYAAPEVTHLLAALIDNATQYSPPDTRTTIRGETVPAGLVIEIEDRALPMSHEKRAALNQMLDAPSDVDLPTQVTGGQIGLFVVALLAQKHGIRVKIQSNIYGGTQAVVVLPPVLLVKLPDVQVQPLPPQAPATVLPGPSARDAQAEPEHQAVGEDTSRTPVPPPLPRRTAAAPVLRAEGSAGEPAAAGGRPPLPRRQEATSAATYAARPGQPAGPPTGGLLGAFKQGQTAAAQTAADQNRDDRGAYETTPATGHRDDVGERNDSE
ncbi:sensor histidine kinase [Streptomyces nanshensis]|uniref:sensor histidine kinase n=1 Tax=Streptomyces nanshensis TaxID=518642 RepID=UPI00085CC678|nr:ATP-binding protein [Streptomyces nanshensis]